MNNLRLRFGRGFTLIELMVVITIIGLLASTVLASLADSRGAARDAVRIQAVKELQKALELYRTANAGKYKCATGSCAAGGAGGVSVNHGGSNTFLIGIAPYFKPNTETSMNSIAPAGMGNTSASIVYRVGSISGDSDNPDRSTYTILVRREQAAGAIPANTWCSISSGSGHTAWNNTTVGQYPPCF